MVGRGRGWCLQYKKINIASQKQLKFKGMGCLYHFYFSHPRAGHQQPRERETRSARGRDLNSSFFCPRLNWGMLLDSFALGNAHPVEKARWGGSRARLSSVILTTSPANPTTVREDIPVNPHNEGEEETRAELVPTRQRGFINRSESFSKLFPNRLFRGRISHPETRFHPLPVNTSCPFLLPLTLKSLGALKGCWWRGW